MNKLKYFTFAIALLSLVSCGNSKKSKDKTNETNTSNESEMTDLSNDAKMMKHPSINLVDFYATAPDWKITIQFDGKVTLTSESKKINFQGKVENISVAQGADVVSILSSNGNDIVRINIDIVECESHGKRVDIMHRVGKEKDETDLSGCGFYRGNPKLHDIWAVTHINDEELNPEKFPKDIPHFEINLESRQFSGFAGCNQVNGVMRFEYNKVRIDPLSSTKMYCAELSEIENKILNILRKGPVNYKVKGTKLILETKEGYLTLKKVD